MYDGHQVNDPNYINPAKQMPKFISVYVNGVPQYTTVRIMTGEEISQMDEEFEILDNIKRSME